MSWKIILVEDDLDDRELFQTFYAERKDFQMLPPALNGLELLEFLESCEDHALPDLIILDQNMPKLNGRNTLALLKGSERYRGITTVVYSTSADPILIEDCIALGAAMVVPKPFTFNGYKHMMDEFLGHLQ